MCRATVHELTSLSSSRSSPRSAHSAVFGFLFCWGFPLSSGKYFPLQKAMHSKMPPPAGPPPVRRAALPPLPKGPAPVALPRPAAPAPCAAASSAPAPPATLPSAGLPANMMQLLALAGADPGAVQAPKKGGRASCQCILNVGVAHVCPGLPGRAKQPGTAERVKATTSETFSRSWQVIGDISVTDLKAALSKMSPSYCNLNQLQPLNFEQHLQLLEHGTGKTRRMPLVSRKRALA